MVEHQQLLMSGKEATRHQFLSINTSYPEKAQMGEDKACFKAADLINIHSAPSLSYLTSYWSSVTMRIYSSALEGLYFVYIIILDYKDRRPPFLNLGQRESIADSNLG